MKPAEEKFTPERVDAMIGLSQELAQAFLTHMGKELDRVVDRTEPADRPMILNMALAMVLSGFFGKRVDEFCAGAVAFVAVMGPIEVVVTGEFAGSSRIH